MGMVSLHAVSKLPSQLPDMIAAVRASDSNALTYYIEADVIEPSEYKVLIEEADLIVAQRSRISRPIFSWAKMIIGGTLGFFPLKYFYDNRRNVYTGFADQDKQSAIKLQEQCKTVAAEFKPIDDLHKELVKAHKVAEREYREADARYEAASEAYRGVWDRSGTNASRAYEAAWQAYISYSRLPEMDFTAYFAEKERLRAESERLHAEKDKERARLDSERAQANAEQNMKWREMSTAENLLYDHRHAWEEAKKKAQPVLNLLNDKEKFRNKVQAMRWDWQHFLSLGVATAICWYYAYTGWRAPYRAYNQAKEIAVLLRDAQKKNCQKSE